MGALLGKCFRLYLHMNENTELFLYPFWEISKFLRKWKEMLSSYQKRRKQQEGVNDIICGIQKNIKDFRISHNYSKTKHHSQR